MRHSPLAALQKVGGALMLPIAVLPVAALLLRLGQPDLLNSTLVATAGQAIFSNLGLLFAVGVAVGLARENHGAAGLASAVAYLVATEGTKVLISVPPAELTGLTDPARELAAAAYQAHELAKLSNLQGVLCGLIAGALYNRFYRIELPSYLSFFGGRRFVPIVSGVAGLALAGLFGTQWQHLEAGMDTVSRSVLGAGFLGPFAYGVLNRLLIVTGLHHILNNVAYFLLGNYHGVTGDLKRFFAGDPTAGVFMSGFFPVMMFGLPAACLAMYHSVAPQRRPAVAGLLGSIALTSLLTGVTEPVEFTFMFLAPALYAVHALLTGCAFIVMNGLGVHLGYGFSAGLIDYVLNYHLATRPLWLLPIGAGYFALYYTVFRFVIVRFDLKTPGRAPQEVSEGDVPAAPPTGQRGEAWLAALGGAANLTSVDACTTRLRLNVVSQGGVDEAALTRLGSRGLVRPGSNALQVVIGTIADQIAGEIRTAMRATGAPPAQASAARAPAVQQAPPAAGTAAACELPDLHALIAALGGRTNLRAVSSAAGRVRLAVEDAARVDEPAILALGLRAVAIPGPGCVHLLSRAGEALALAQALGGAIA